jgi:hypothetical protein
MKFKLLLLSALAGFSFLACEDFSTLGVSLQPDGDKITVYDSIIGISASTVRVDSVYAKTMLGALGDFYDPSFGTLNAGYACEFYPSAGFKGIDSITGGKIDSVYLHLSYSYLGDSLAPMGLTLYPVVKSLEKNYYTNVQPETFCDMNSLVTQYGYTARNMEISDSAIEALSYSHNLYIPLPQEFGQAFLDSVKSDTSYVTNISKFKENFKGLYLASTFGTGSMLYNISTKIYFYYSVPAITTTADGLSDSTYISSRMAVWAVTDEVFQLNSFKYSKLPELNVVDSVDYIISPSGVYTELTIPVKEIINGVGNKQFSTVSLELKPYLKSDWEYALPFPGTGSGTASAVSKLLLIPPDSVAAFFENQRVAGSSKANYANTATLTVENSVSAYRFTNISNIINYASDNNIDDLKLWVIPVTTATTTDSYSQYYDYATSPDLSPSGVKLNTGADNLKIRVQAYSNAEK